ncbi:MAG: LysE family translocator [Gammaproteobacteria bacterium]|nr:LysE family translocator [Gammaproteobacteria bacterium]
MTLIIAMFAFSLSMSISPGPVNLICLSSGLNYGFKRTLPFISGATVGFVLLLTTIGLGLSTITSEYSLVFNTLKYLGSAFIGYMGINVFLSAGKLEINKNYAAKPTFKQGLLLQWLNPKAWVACMAGSAAFNAANSPETLGLFVTIYFMVCYCGIACWALVGVKISKLLTQPKQLKIINRLMGIALGAVAIYLSVI